MPDCERRSLKEIGEYFGGFDHSTILYGAAQMQNYLDTEPTMRLLLDKIRSELREIHERKTKKLKPL